MAQAEADPEAGWAALRQGEALLAKGCACHNHFELRVAGIDLSRRRGAWDEALRHAAALEQYLGDEPCSYAALSIDGARLLAALATGRAGGDARARLGELRARAERLGLRLIARSLADTFTPG